MFLLYGTYAYERVGLLFRPASTLIALELRHVCIHCVLFLAVVAIMADGRRTVQCKSADILKYQNANAGVGEETPALRLPAMIPSLLTPTGKTQENSYCYLGISQSRILNSRKKTEHIPQTTVSTANKRTGLDTAVLDGGPGQIRFSQESKMDKPSGSGTKMPGFKVSASRSSRCKY
jgi:hypothetical protein